jgi:hypothetical protein
MIEYVCCEENTGTLGFVTEKSSGNESKKRIAADCGQEFYEIQRRTASII